ncbi:MAG: dihydrodipicolinate synthase family protein, partial [Spirochaetes bacterium]|nr:dihydrodipicolinate synthase family protein [Spirochaetota bacterium]
MKIQELRKTLAGGLVIPAHPLALTAQRKLDERRQRGLSRYYLDAGAGGLAVGVHTTQFAIRSPSHGLYRPVLALAAEEADAFQKRTDRRIVKVAGAIGPTAQALAEAEAAAGLGYDAVLLGLGWAKGRSWDELANHCEEVSKVLPLFGFYLQPAAGGILLPYGFWRKFLEIDNIAAIKVAPFNRYHTIDVARALAESGRADEVSLYTGNDDAIVMDLLTPYTYEVGGTRIEMRFRGGLLGHWAVWTRRVVELVERIGAIARSGSPVPPDILRIAVEVTDANAAFFDAANGFAGSIAGIHEVLVRQGLMAGRWCLDPAEDLSPGQAQQIDRVARAYPPLCDDEFVSANRDRWLA